MAYESIAVKPLGGTIGAEISGVDLGARLSNRVVEEIHEALLEYLVVFFRGQNLTPEQLVTFGRHFGEVYAIPFVAGLAERPEVIEIVKEADEVRTHNFGGTWHTDMSFEEAPAMASVLYALETPPKGGDTIFANMYAAYESLSPALQETLAGMTAMHSAKRSYGSRGRFSAGGTAGMRIATGAAGDAEVEHPVVRTHPETGRRCLFVNPNYTIRFRDMTEEESRPLLDFLNARAHREEFTCRFRWEPGSVAFWDNRCTQHRAVNDYDGHRRRMHRITLRGDRPYL